MASKNKLFYAEAAKGYILKVMVDSLTGPLQRVYINLDEEGFKIRQSDSGNTILYDINLPRKNFKGFRCVRKITISVNLKHMQGLLRNVKKKDSIAMYIDPTKLGKFFIMIRPEGARKNVRFETNSIVYQEEKDFKLEDLPDGGYKYPMVIEATDFQKIKRLTTIGKVIGVVIQNNNYLSFKCDAGVVFDSELGFGELLEDPFDEEDQQQSSVKVQKCSKCSCGKSPKNCWCECDVCGEYLCDCECTCKKCKEYLCDCVCVYDRDKVEDHTEDKPDGGYDSLDDGEIPGLFEAQYYSSILTKLVKLPGLCTQMQFYAPTIPRYPLRIEVNAGQGGFTLGTIQVFIKDVEQIEYEQSLENQNVIVTKTKGKSKKKI
jgi:hypothetical protein